ncbi:hypothetical protein MNEG_14329 [Monoraphidium neglectum]|uniref:Uncharacterized protein n=1 Tax=Monoraphidium neglectum TaxID=145388 RepID=A0A0D2J0S1_9CHLO|nr:hypothetical protein MNEG_14329 [Monoraphidium neglectum]KIY93632.1 hypothetical protein MNEG_14329 [Monoraphidium neglectum]|eukprot:XP_013892652.1 hypothetical protein MNEG_14329 [Monoraphidium neglectum]
MFGLLRGGKKNASQEVQPITVLKTDFKLAHLRQITANSLYIVYGLRAGQLRCINKASAGRALYKGHAAPIADAAFFSPDSNLLASASVAGDLIVRQIVEVDDPSGSSGAPVPLAALVMRAALAPPPPGGAVRVAWHPAEPRILAAASGGSAGIFMPAAPPSEAAEQAPLAPASPSWELALPPGRAATALAFSPSGDVLVAGDAQGGASAWALGSGAAAAGGPPAAALQWAPHGGDAVSYVCFLSQDGPGAPSVLVTADAAGRRLRLWRLPGADALGGGGGGSAAAELLQSLELASAAGPSDFFCHAAHSAQAQLLILANAQRKQVHALHYAPAPSPEGGAAGAAFDFVASFAVKQPVLSVAAGYDMAESEASPGQMEPHVHLYCVQPDAVQQYMLDPELCAKQQQQQQAAASAAALLPQDERQQEKEPAAAPPAPAPAVAPEPKQQPPKQHPGSLASPAGMPPLPTTLSAKAHADKGGSGGISRESSLQAAAAAALPGELQPAVAPTVAVTPLPANDAPAAAAAAAAAAAVVPAAAGAAPHGAATGEELEEGEIPPQQLVQAAAPGDAAAAAAAANAAEVAHLRRQLDRLVSSQQSLASQLRSEVADGLRASEAAVAARVEAAVVKALNKRAEDERRRAKDLEKALTQQITQYAPDGCHNRMP